MDASQTSPDAKIIGCRWVLRTKYNADGGTERRKARLVAKGNNQRPGIDFDKTFSAVARQSTIRLLMAIAVEMDLEVYQLDVVLAYIPEVNWQSDVYFNIYKTTYN